MVFRADRRERQLVYETFDINETALTKIEVGHEDYDVFCPSEYIIERMLKKDLLIPIQKELIADSIYYFDNISPFATAKFQQMAPKADVKVSDYTVGYMWGTTGFIYNPQFVDREDLTSWAAILNPKFENRILMKDASAMYIRYWCSMHSVRISRPDASTATSWCAISPKPAWMP